MNKHRQQGHRWSRLGLVIGIIFITSGCADWSPSGVPLDELKPDETMPLFWRVQGGQGADLYILSSADVGGPSEGWVYPAAITQAFDRSNALVVGSDPTEISGDQTQALISAYGSLPPGVSLRDALSPEIWKKLEPELKTMGVPLIYADRMQPWLLESVLKSEAIRRLGLSLRNGVETSFIRQAKDRSVIALEPIEFQISIAVRMPLEIQAAPLQQTLVQFETMDDWVKALVNGWRSGDARSLTHLLLGKGDATEASQAFFEIFVLPRSQNMTEQLNVLLEAEQHHGEQVFVIIAANHLVGPQGIPALLKSRGYQLKRYTPAALRHPLPGD